VVPTEKATILLNRTTQNSCANATQNPALPCVRELPFPASPTFANLATKEQQVIGHGGSMARRRYQKASLFFRSGKRRKVWVGRWREDVIENGQVRRIRRAEVLGTLSDFPTRKLAQRELDTRLTEINSPSYRARPTATFEQFARSWKAKILPSWKPSSAANSRSHLKRHLTAFFGKMQLREVGPEVVQQFVSLLQPKVSAKTLRNVVMTLRSMWGTAKAWGYVGHDAFDRVVLPELGRNERFFLSLKEIQSILEAAGEPYRTFYWLLAETGLRAGELCGLRYEDVDAENRVVRVRQSVWRGRTQTPKSRAAYREAAISPELAAQLVEYKQAWRPNTRRLLFATCKGTPWHQDLLVKRHLRPLAERLKITLPKGNGLHAFRHAIATEMDRRGVPLAVRTRRLGHSDVSLTLGTYTHAISEDERKFVSELGKILDPNGPKIEIQPVQQQQQQFLQ
jgi:integrase